MIGNERDASAALMHYEDDNHSYILDDLGTTRAVYLINDVVYKVERKGWKGANEEEYNTIVSSRLDLKTVKFPECNLFHVDGKSVIAMEYIEGKPMSQCLCVIIRPGSVCSTDYCLPDRITKIVSRHITDVSGQNVVKSGKIYYIVDAAQ